MKIKIRGYTKKIIKKATTRETTKTMPAKQICNTCFKSVNTCFFH